MFVVIWRPILLAQHGTFAVSTVPLGVDSRRGER